MRKKRRKTIISVCILIVLSLQILALPYIQNQIKKETRDDVHTYLTPTPVSTETREGFSIPTYIKQENNRSNGKIQLLTNKYTPLQTLDQENSVKLLNETRGLKGKFSTIQAAVSQSQPNDTILVNSTTYNSTIEEFPIELTVNNLTLMSTQIGKALIKGYNRTLLKIRASEVTINGFKIVGGKNGISLTGNKNLVKNNTIINNSNYGIYLKNSERSTIINNNMTENRIGFFVTGDNRSHYNHTITDNYVKGKEAYYFFNASSKDIKTNGTRHLSIVYSKDITITGKNIDSGDYLRLCHTHNITLTKNRFKGNYNGIDVEESWNVTIKNNTLVSNINGVNLKNSTNISIIDNNIETNKAYGLYAEKLKNSKISQNQFNQSITAISFNSSLKTTISGNSLLSAKPYGIHLKGSTNIKLIENNIVNCKVGVYLETSNNNTISKNIITQARKIGIFLQASNNNEIKNCTISPLLNNSQTSNYGIYLKNSTYNHFEYSEIRGFSSGVFLERAEKNLLINNLFSSKEGSQDSFGIQLLFSYNNTIEKNKIYSKNSSGIRLSLSGENELKNNEIEGISYAISLYRATNNQIIGNHLSHSDYGIYLYHGSGTTIVNNQIVESFKDGIHLIHSDNTVIRENEVLTCKEHGIFLSYSDNGEISENRILNNSQNGINLLFSQGVNIVENNVTLNSQSGIYLFRASNNVIMANNISKNYNGLYLNHASDNIVVRNTFDHNEGKNIKEEETISNRINSNTFQGKEEGIFERFRFIRLVILLGLGIITGILFFVFIIKRK